MGQMLSVNTALHPGRIGARDLVRAMTFREWNHRACRLANALIGLGLVKGDRVAVLAYNAVEWMEIYAATAKAGLVAVPINFRLLAPDILYILENSGAKALIVQDELVSSIDAVHAQLPIVAARMIHFGRRAVPAGFTDYETLLAASSQSEPDIAVAPEDIWVLMYTSGTTGKPKGAMRSHGSHALLNYATLLDMKFDRDDTCLLVMPMCHANSLNFASAFAWAGATVCVYDRKSFDAEELLRTLAATRATFTSLVPTHYIMMLGLPAATKAACNVDSVAKLLVSSAPARKDTKLAIMEFFRNSQLLELYGSTEQGWATLLRPEEQLTKLGSVGREFTGSGRIRLLDESGRDVAEGEIGELYSRTPWCFSGYWNLPDKTAESFRGPYLSVGDMARRDADGFYVLVDRKNNMIISGGENVYPSEVENLLGQHPKIRDVAVIGRADPKWGEAVHAVIVLRDGESATEAEFTRWCATRIAGYKRPRSFAFIADADMPRTSTGKILHRELKRRV
jgi:acyl-CoA synthetase (AMP-forming)/AMP-acid ligase II